MTALARLTCLAATAALLLGACTPKSSGYAGPSVVDSGARDLRTDRGTDAGTTDSADDAGASDLVIFPDAPADAPPTDATTGDAPPDAPTTDAPPDAPTTDAPPDVPADIPADTAAAPDTRDSAGDATLTPDLLGVDVRDALPIDLGSDARDGNAG